MDGSIENAEQAGVVKIDVKDLAETIHRELPDRSNLQFEDLLDAMEMAEDENGYNVLGVLEDMIADQLEDEYGYSIQDLGEARMDPMDTSGGLDPESSLSEGDTVTLKTDRESTIYEIEDINEDGAKLPGRPSRKPLDRLKPADPAESSINENEPSNYGQDGLSR